MNQLSDRRRESVLWLVADGFSLRGVRLDTGTHKNTAAMLVEAFHSIVVTAGWKLDREFRDLDKYVTTKQMPLNGRLRQPSSFRTGLPLLYTRAVLDQARSRCNGHHLMTAALPLIKAYYAPKTRGQILLEEVRADGGTAPPDCMHCGGVFSWKRHEEICVRHKLHGL